MITKRSGRGNCRYLNSGGWSGGISGFLEINTASPLVYIVKIVASIPLNV